MVNFTTTTARILLLLVLAFCSHLLRCSAEEEITCILDETLAPVRVEIETDDFPSETQWELNDAFSRDAILSRGPYDIARHLYIEKKCVKKTGCYQFTISDVFGDGLFPSAYYEIYYDNFFIKRGEGNFGFLDHSPLFGEGCPTIEPSLSLHPSKSPSPSQTPSAEASAKPSISTSFKPSLEPTESYKPTAQVTEKPSFSPTDTAQPTSSPTDIYVAEFAKDSLGRRFFPAPLLQSSKRSFPYQPPPKCNSEDEGDSHFGCITFPKPEQLEWAGKLVQTQPECTSNKNGRKKMCDLSIPRSKNLVPIYLKPASSGFDESNKMTLPGDPRQSFFVTSADMNSDDNVDIVVANLFAPNQLFYNKGNGEFEDPIDICNETLSSFTLRIADIDDDGLKDIVCPDSYGSSYILWGKGNKEFTTANLPIGPFIANDVAFWDFDGDGLLDIVVATYYSPNIILMNNGDRSFTSTFLPQNIPVYSFSVVCGDLDNDGDVDIIVGSVLGGQSELFQNNGNGTFELTNLPGISGDVNDIGLIDMDSNGYLDFILANGGDPNQILWNHGNYNFTVQDLPGGSRTTYSLNIGDLDGDGQLDLVFANRQNPHLLISYNGNNEFNVIELPYVGPEPRTSTLADLDNNGLLDIVFSTNYQGIQVLMDYVDNRLSGSLSEDFLSVNLLDEPQNTVAIVAGPLLDINSYLDIVVGNFRQPNQLVLISDDGSDHETITLPGGSLETTCIVLMHFNNDNAFDIFVGNINGPNQVLVNRGEGPFDVIEIPGSNDVPTTAAASGDMDNNGLMDLVVGNRRYRNQLILNRGDGTFITVDLPGDQLDETTSIALADFNGDTFLDVVVGNGYDVAQPNYLLTNNQDDTFESEELPGGDRVTSSIVIGDLYNNNERLDIVVGNFQDTNYILQNNGSGFEVQDLPGGTLRTNALALADIDDDGDLDIIASNGFFLGEESNQLILNLDNGIFEDSIIPNTVGVTRALTVCDLDKDGTLDLIFGNYGALNTYFYRSVCKSGAQLHSQSWCFECPQFMGRKISFLGQTGNACLECMPGHMQSSSSEFCAEFPCQFGERSLGTDECKRCSLGTFYNASIVREESNSESWKSPHCVDCNQGQYSDWSLPAINECFQCSPGTSQNNTRSSSCPACRPGTFQSLPGQTTCDVCKAGGYCSDIDTCGGGFQSCSPGTYNDKEGQSNISACTKCPAGTFSTTIGADSIASCTSCPKGSFTSEDGGIQCQQCSSQTYQPDEGQTSCVTCAAGFFTSNSTSCKPCPKGSYTSEDGQTQCQLCPLGTFQSKENQTSCLPCVEGTFANNPGLVECSRCPSRLFSTKGSETCSFCHENYYLIDSGAEVGAIFEKPDDYCEECPTNAECPQNTTLQTLEVPPNYWRESSRTSTIYKCNNKSCKGWSPRSFQQRMSDDTGTYCITGHKGPLCQVCVDDYQYFNTLSGGICEDCPPFTRLLIPFGIIVGLIIIFFISRIAAIKFEGYRNILQKVSNKLSLMSLQAKLKILISFYQIIKTLEDVYGVEVDERVKGWLDFLQIFQLGLSEIASLPTTCIGSMRTRLLLGGTWPIMAICLCFIGIVCYTCFIMKRRTNVNDNLKQFVWMRLLYTSILIIFLTLPSIAVTIFDAKKCQPFDSNDTTNEMASYLISDWSVKCEQDDGVYQQLQTLFWAFFAIWLIVIPLCLFGLLMRIKESVQSQQITPLAEACSFLWRDYKREFMYWEVVSLIHKMFLTGMIMLVDTQEGSGKVLRLMMANLFCTIYFGMLLYASPFQRKEDQDLALISNVLLIGCFVLGVPIQQCNDGSETCQELYGLHLNSYRVSVLAVGLIISMLVVTLIFVIIVGVNRTPDPVIKVVHTLHEPVLDLPRDCNYHAFVSHIWSSGQDKTHALVRKLKLYLPGIKVWLDVVDLKNLDDLELSVQESTVFLLMYTDGYFKSRNCRREVYEALRCNKPVIVLYEGNESVIEQIKERCLQYCSEEEGLSSDEVLRYILTERPLLWLGAASHYFSTAAIKKLSERILRNLPYYQNNPNDLSKGLKVSNELKEVDLPTECVLLYSLGNYDVEDIASEIRAAASNENCVVVDNVERYFEMKHGSHGEAFFLLYLNDQLFSDDAGLLKDQVKEAKDKGLQIILVHEKDVNMGAVEFDNFFVQTPRELLVSPYKLYDDLAIPLYSDEEYRKVSLRLILCRMRETMEESRPGLMRKMILNICRK